MIKLTKANVNSLISKYFEDEGYVYSKFVFKSETGLEEEPLRKNLDLVSLVAMGLQYLYGVEHYKDGTLQPCEVLYSLVEDHRCETVRVKAGLEVKRRGRKKIKIERVEVEEKEVKEVKKEDEINEEIVNDIKGETVNDIKDEIVASPFLTLKDSSLSLEFTERSLTECREAELVAWNGDYLAIKTISNELFAFRFGVFLWKLGIVDISAIQWNDLGLVTGELNGRVSILNPINCRRKIYEKHSGEVTKILFWDKRIFSCARDGFIYSTDDSFSFKVFPEGIKDALFLPHSLIFCISYTGKMAVVDIKNNSETVLKSHSATINSLALDPETSLVATGDQEGTISIYNPRTNEQTFFSAYPTSVSFLCWTRGMLVSSSLDNIIKVWKMDEPVAQYLYPGAIRNMKSCRDIVALISDDQTISLFDHQMALISRYSLVGTPKAFEFSEAGDSLCVLLENNHPLIINLVRSK